MSVFDVIKNPVKSLTRTEERFQIENPILYSDENPELYLLLYSPLSKDAIASFVTYIKSIVDCPIRLICSLKFDEHGVEKKQGELKRMGLSQAEIEKQVPFVKLIKSRNFKFYDEKSVDLTRFIPVGSRVISFSLSIKNVTTNPKMENEDFLDNELNEDYFFSPDLKSWIFPTFGLGRVYSFKNETPLDSASRRRFEDTVRAAYNLRKRRSHPTIEIREVDNAIEFFESHQNDPEWEVVAWDLETTSLDWYDGEVICMTLSNDGRIGYYIQWDNSYIDAFQKFIVNKKSVGANLKFDIKFLKRRGVTGLNIYFDTLQAGHVLNEERSNSLKTHAFMYTPFGGYDRELERYKANHKINSYADFPKKLLVHYATMDSIVTFRVYEAMKKQMQDDKLTRTWKYFNETVMPTLNMFIDMEFKGVYINWDRVRKQGLEFQNQTIEIESRWYKVSGSTISPYKTAQLREFFFKENPVTGSPLIEADPEYLTETKEPALGKAALDHYINTVSDTRVREMLEIIKEHRVITKLYNTYVGNENDRTGLWKYRKPDGKIYPEYGVMLAGTHRHRSSKPNMQNFPHHGEHAKLIRSLFDVPTDIEGTNPEDWEIWSKDYKGLQLRIGSIVSHDEVMKAVWTSDNPDLHSVTARSVFQPQMTLEEFIARKDEEEIDKNRLAGKQINFKFLFGGGARSFRDETIAKQWTEEDCHKYIREAKIPILIDPLEFRKIKEQYMRDHPNEDESRAAEVARETTPLDIFYTVAVDLRAKFFETYPGLKRWVETYPFVATGRQCGESEPTHNADGGPGYIKYVFGGRKLLPLLKYPKLHTRGEKKGTPVYDEKKDVNSEGNIIHMEYGDDQIYRFINSLQTQSLNNVVQNFEAVVVNKAMVEMNERFVAEGLKSRIFVQVHDEVAFYVYKPERDRVREITTEIMDQDRPEYDGVPIITDTQIADPRGSEPTYWGYGVDE